MALISFITVAVVVSAAQAVESAYILFRRGQVSRVHMFFGFAQLLFGAFALWEALNPQSKQSLRVAVAYIAYLIATASFGVYAAKRANIKVAPGKPLPPFPIASVALDLALVSAFLVFSLLHLQASHA